MTSPPIPGFRHRNRLKSIAGLLLVVGLCFAPPVLPQGQYTVYGTVRQPDASPASGATVDIEGQAGMRNRAFADNLGRYEISGVLRGRYRIAASNPADPKQMMEPVEIDTSQFVGARILINLNLRFETQPAPPKDKTPGVVSAAEVSQQAPRSAQKALDQAREHRRKEKLDDALKSYDKAVQIFPEYFQAIAERGHLLIVMQRPASARQDFERALKINPLYGPALRGAGMCEFQEGKFSEAVRTLTRAADAEPGNATNYLFIGTAEAALDQRDQARSALLKALSLDPIGSVRAHVHLARLWIKDGHPTEAIREIEAYLEAAPKAADADQLRKVLANLRSQTQKS